MRTIVRGPSIDTGMSPKLSSSELEWMEGCRDTDCLRTDYYLYVLLDPRTPTWLSEGLQFHHAPFYVGKGTGPRYRQHRGDDVNNPLKATMIRSILGDGLYVVALLPLRGLTEPEAYALEQRYIAQIGRIITGTGPLTNICGGGKGGLRGRPRAGLFGELNPFYGRHHSEATREFLSTLRSGKRLSIAHRKAISSGVLGKRNPSDSYSGAKNSQAKHWTVIPPDGGPPFQLHGQFFQWCRTNGVSPKRIKRYGSLEEAIASPHPYWKVVVE